MALLRTLLVALATVALLGAQEPATGETKKVEKLAAAADFYVHEFHATQLEFDCSVCHVTTDENSVVMARPGHDQCILCHEANYTEDLTEVFCGQCHSSFPPFTNEDLLPYPLFKKERAIVFEFSHALHVDPNDRTNAKTGFRADCTFCHQFDDEGIFAKFPGHQQCTACHSKPEISPNLTPTSDTPDCRGCHVPEEIENPGYTKDRGMISETVVSGVYVNLKFSHVAHFKNKESYDLDCTTCHYSVETSTGLADLSLPKMLDCVECHDVDSGLPEEFRMSNCSTCHIDPQEGSLPASHSKNVKPLFHNESFRVTHEEEATTVGAKCYVCHQNVEPAQTAEAQCVNCHQVMEPATHTARWRDDVHGKVAAMDRTSCSTCHVADTCVRCHNQTPRSHQPLPLFVNGGHAPLAMLEQRACFTCHTFDNTCSRCHVR